MRTIGGGYMRKAFLLALPFLIVSCGDILKIDSGRLGSNQNPILGATMNLQESRKLSLSEANAVFTICSNLAYKKSSLFPALRTAGTKIYQDIQERNCAASSSNGEAVRKVDYFGGNYSYQLQPESTASGQNQVDDASVGQTAQFCRLWNIANPTDNYTIVKDGSTYYEMGIVTDGCASDEICFEMRKSGAELRTNFFSVAGAYGFSMFTTPSAKRGFFSSRAYSEACSSSSSSNSVREDWSSKNTF